MQEQQGLHLVVVPRDSTLAEALPCNTIVLPAGLIEDCVAFTSKPKQGKDLPAAMAALQFVLAHELAHVYLRHGVSNVGAALALLMLPFTSHAACWVGRLPSPAQGDYRRC